MPTIDKWIRVTVIPNEPMEAADFAALLTGFSIDAKLIGISGDRGGALRLAVRSLVNRLPNLI